MSLIGDDVHSGPSPLTEIFPWDGFLKWYYALQESIPFMCDMDLREQRALDNMQLAIDMKEI